MSFYLGGVDTVDKMLSCYSCKRKTCRWPMTVFSNIIDISALNALIIFKDIHPTWQETQKTTIRRKFLKELGLALAQPYMATRVRKPRAETAARLLTDISLDAPSCSSNPPKQPKIVPSQIKGRARCYLCYENRSASKNNVFETICCFCKKAACKKEHNRNICVKCIEEKFN